MSHKNKIKPNTNTYKMTCVKIIITSRNKVKINLTKLNVFYRKKKKKKNILKGLYCNTLFKITWRFLTFRKKKCLISLIILELFIIMYYFSF